MSKNKAILIGVIAAIVVVIGLANFRTSSSDLIEMSFDPPFALTDHNGRAVTEKDFADKYALVYFGFTSCPDVCPVDLQKLAPAYEKLSQDKKDKLQVLFITIDPSHDTPPVIKDYLANFNANFLGLTGSAQAIEAVKKNYKMYAEKVEQGGHGDHHGGSNYTFNHTALFYILAPQNKPLGVLKNDLDAAALVRNLSALIH